MKGFRRARAEGRTGISHADFTRIRNVQLGRFTIDRLMTVLNKLGQDVDVQIDVHRVGLLKKRLRIREASCGQHVLDVCKTENPTRDTTHGGACRTALSPMCRKRPFTTHADRLRPRLEGGLYTNLVGTLDTLRSGLRALWLGPQVRRDTRLAPPPARCSGVKLSRFVPATSESDDLYGSLRNLRAASRNSMICDARSKVGSYPSLRGRHLPRRNR